jgi:Raf kinase inhibitor-like YbhB/YbcL family protein
MNNPGEGGVGMRSWISLALCCCIFLLLCGCGGKEEGAKETAKGSELAPEFKLTSKNFTEGESIPREHTCDGADASPELSWENPPDGTRSFAIICEDPDAPGGTWIHWVIWAIPAKAAGMPEGVPPESVLSNGAKQGTTDFGTIGYGGPCPPAGKPHRYTFQIYALDNITGLEPGADERQLIKAMKGHVIAETRLMGTYGR